MRFVGQKSGLVSSRSSERLSSRSKNALNSRDMPASCSSRSRGAVAGFSAGIDEGDPGGRCPHDLTVQGGFESGRRERLELVVNDGYVVLAIFIERRHDLRPPMCEPEEDRPVVSSSGNGFVQPQGRLLGDLEA